MQPHKAQPFHGPFHVSFHGSHGSFHGPFHGTTPLMVRRVLITEVPSPLGSNRQEKPLPPDLDEKQTRRILRNRASAERSRLRRLCKITALEQENTELRRQVESRNNERKPNGGGPLAEDIEHSNRQLRAELQLMRDRVSTLTSLLSRHSSS